MIYLKRDSVYTPIIFQHPNLVNKKYCQIDDTIGYKRITTEYSFKLNLDITNIKSTRILYPRQQLTYSEIPGGLVRSNGNIIAIVVVKDEEQYVIVELGFSLTNTSAFARLKKSINDLGISSRTKLLLWSSGQLYSTFQEMITVNMSDYLPENQLLLSKEFISSERIKYPISTVEVKEDSKVFDFVIGDWITILDAPINFNSTMRQQSGRTVQITYANNRDMATDIIFEESSNWSWRFKNGHFRHATREEINKELGIQVVDTIPDPTTLDEVIFVEPRNFIIGDWVVVTDNILNTMWGSNSGAIGYTFQISDRIGNNIHNFNNGTPIANISPDNRYSINWNKSFIRLATPEEIQNATSEHIGRS